MRIPRRFLAVGALATVATPLLSACSTGHGEPGERTLVITVCDQQEARGGGVDIITAEDGEVFYLIPSQAESRLAQGLVYEIDVEPSGDTDSLIVRHKQLPEEDAQACP